MSERYKVDPSRDLHFITCTVVGWIDVFTRPVYREIIYESLRFCQVEMGLKIHGFVIMTNHVHFLMSTSGKPLNKILKSFKQFTAMQLLEAISTNIHESRKGWIMNIFKLCGQNGDRNHQFWQHKSHPVAMWTPKRVKAVLDYIHENPVKTGLVDLAAEFPHSSARVYHDGRKVEVEVEVLDLLE